MTPDPYLGERTVMRAFLDSVLPPGWAPEPGGDFDHLLDGIGDNLQTVYDFLTLIGEVRNPNSTPYLDELEREFGITPDTHLTDTQRRATLVLVKYKRGRRGTIDDMQFALDITGFGTGGLGLTVYENDPAVDPGLFTNYAYVTWCNQPTACCGYNLGGPILAQCGLGGGLYLVNGDVYKQDAPAYLQTGEATAYSGYVAPGGGATDYQACSGYYTAYIYSPVIWPSPADSWAWPMVFFIGGAATFDGSGHLTSCAMVNVPQSLIRSFVDLVMRFKPMHCWAACMITLG